MKADTADGYVQEIGYTHGYCVELAPSLMALACISRGVNGPFAREPLRYLELAFGQGVSFNIHAAAAPGEYWGLDLNPAHAANALDLAQASGAGARVFGESFEAFGAREDVPQFDVIALHATWSWISAENRTRVVDLVRRKLAPGGVFFVSYNCMPGWAAEVPLRHLLVQHATLAAEGDLASRIDASLEFAQAMLDAGARMFRAHPGLEPWLEDMQGRSRQYLAHEYFNRDWHPMPSAEVAQALAAADLSFAASAKLSDHLPGIGMPAKARALLQSVDHPQMRETAFDTLTNQRMRRDLFTRGTPALAPADRTERLRSLPFTLLQHPDHVRARIAVTGGEVELDPDVLRPFVAAMAERNFTPKPLRELEDHPKCGGIGFDRLVETALLLTSAGSLHPAQSQSVIVAAEPRCKALNARILEQAAQSDNVSALASPVTGAGVYAVRREMLFLRAIARGLPAEGDWALHAWECLGKDIPIESLQADAHAFARIRLPLLKALRVA